MSFSISKYHFNSVDLFEDLSKEHLQLLKASIQRIEVKKGGILFRKGTRSKGVYLLQKGKVKVYQMNEDGKSQIVYIYKAGEFLGYRPLLCNGTHPVTAEVLEDAVISFIPRSPFFQVLTTSHALSKKLLFNLSHEFAIWINTTTAFARQNVRERFALALLILSEIYRKEGNKKEVELNLSREDLANYVGTAIETLVRIIKEFKEKKILEARGRKIKIINPDELAEMIEVY